MQLFHLLFIATFIFKGTKCCKETSTSFDALTHCNDISNQASAQSIFLLSNITIGQKIDFCAVSDPITFDSLRILTGGDIIGLSPSQRIDATANFLYSFYIYDYDEWISAHCDNNIYDISCSSSISPILSLDDTSRPILGYNPDNIPFITFKFPYPGLVISTPYSSLIWLLSVNKGFPPSDIPIASFIVCDISDFNTDNIPYKVYPEKYNDIQYNDTSLIYTLSSECSTTEDNSLTSLNPFETCGYPEQSESKFTGISFRDIGETYYQYFALFTETKLYGISLFFDAPPNTQNSADCSFTFDLNLYNEDSNIVRSAQTTVTSLSDTAQPYDFIFDDSLVLDTTDLYDYFYFQVSITGGLVEGGGSGGGPGGKGRRLPDEGTQSSCDIGMMLCYDQSAMKTWVMDINNEEDCFDFYMDFNSKIYQHVDVAFDIITSITDTTESPEITSNPTDNPIDTTLVYYTSLDIDIETTGSTVAADARSVVDFEESVALSVAVGILAGIGMILLLSAFIVSRYTKADNFIYAAVVIFIVHSIDVFSDIFFCISIWTDHALIVEVNNRGTFILLAIASLVFIVVPMFKNFYDLIQFQRETQDDPLHGDRYRAWLNTFGTTLLIFALISGSTFGTMKLMNSNLLGLRMFSMGLCISHLRDYHSYRMVNVVLMENLPQLVIQIVFASALEAAVPPISIVAAITSVLSIIVAIVDHFSKKELTKQAVPSTLLTFQITSSAISAAPSKYKNRQQKVIKGISKILILDKAAIEILTIDEYSDQMGDGLIVHFLITTIKYNADEIHQKLKDSVINGSMARNMSKAWDLVQSDPPSISHLRWLKIQSVDDEQTEGGTNNTTNNTANNTTNTTVSNIEIDADASGSNLKKKIVVKASDTPIQADIVDTARLSYKDINEPQISPITEHDDITPFPVTDKVDDVNVEIEMENMNKN